ncbi:NEW3 domain-containing protein [Lysobacter sp. CFH 32150]|uniref:NEW3 domain-containing protein n=1 Tax=Lysobacter sp. CFH 32150 TaxID=2927128 RepID=UPI001FA71A19|nr:NEW3 domain-containing protein [Lysobacter sp. CFH 32150]MCI4568558.1 NEW3 domain-containing protein [Lysobacter sp. CFH 32150]
MHLSRAFRHAGRFTANLLLLSGLMAGAAHAAKPVALEGELDVLVEDYADGHSVTRHFLKTEHGRVELKFSRKPTTLLSGTRVRVRGEVQGEYLTLDSAQAGSVEALTTVLPNTLGEQKVAVILVNFQDDTTQPITPAAANTLVLSTVSEHYRESSFGQTWFSGQTFGYYTLPLSKAVCDPVKWYTEADKAVVAAGGDLSSYTRRIYFFPRVDTCGWDGLATQGFGGVTKTYINGAAAATLRVVGHEIGHNYGLNHAHSLDCDLSPLGDTCRESSYGDVADMMGGYRSGHFSAFAKEQLGWLNDGISPPILTASASGRFAIEPYSSSSVGAKAVKVPGGVDSLGRTRWYYLEYRQPTGFDVVLADAGNLTSGVMVRVASEGDRDSMYQLDMHPGLSNTTSTDMLDGALAVGQTYVDAVANVSFTVVSLSSSAATIDVTVGGAPPPVCTRAAPSLSLAGPTSGAAGTTLNYSISLTNRDSSGCSATTFNLARSLPSGWTGNLSVSNLSLSPGTSGTATLTVTSPATAAAGSYGLAVGTSSPAGATHTASASTTYTVAAPVILSATIGTDKTSYLRAETVYMSALVRNGSGPVSGASVKFTLSLPGGATTVLNAVSGLDGYARSTYKLGKGKAAIGTYQVRADATSSGASATASTSFGVR